VLIPDGEEDPTSETNIKDLSKNEVKQQKLSVISGSSEQQLQQLPEGERQKAGEMKEAVGIL
jgi:hypothetical protein